MAEHVLVVDFADGLTVVAENKNKNKLVRACGDFNQTGSTSRSVSPVFNWFPGLFQTITERRHIKKCDHSLFISLIIYLLYLGSSLTSECFKYGCKIVDRVRNEFLIQAILVFLCIWLQHADEASEHNIWMLHQNMFFFVFCICIQIHHLNAKLFVF